MICLNRGWRYRRQPDHPVCDGLRWIGHWRFHPIRRAVAGRPMVQLWISSDNRFLAPASWLMQTFIVMWNLLAKKEEKCLQNCILECEETVRVSAHFCLLFKYSPFWNLICCTYWSCGCYIAGRLMWLFFLDLWRGKMLRSLPLFILIICTD